MSVRATGSLIGDPVCVTALPGSPRMIVISVDADKRQITTVWFSNNGDAQSAVFPASAIDRVEVTKPSEKKVDAGTKPAGKKK